MTTDAAGKEQTTITNYLNKTIAKIDKTIRKIEKKIAFLEEYKKSLIYYIVTEKINIKERCQNESNAEILSK